MFDISIYFVSNCASTLQALRDGLSELGYVIAGESGSLIKAENDLFKRTPNVIILDLDIGKSYEVIEFAKELRNSSKKELSIIFISSRPSNNTFKMAEEIDPAAYQIKPVNIYNISYAIELTFKKRETQYFSINNTDPPYLETANNALHIRKMHKIVRVPLNSIYYIAVEANYSTVATDLGKFTVRKSLKDLMNKLPCNTFLRIHRNYMVNTNQIIEYDLSEFTAQLPDKSLPIGRRYRKYITQRLNLLS